MLPLEEAIELIKKNNPVLLVAPKDPNGDILGGLLGLFFALENYQKKADILLPGGFPEKFNFLPRPSFLTSLSSLSDLLISVPENERGIDELSYEKKGGKILIYLTPKKGTIKKEEIEISSQINPPFQLLISAGFQNLKSLEEIFEENPNLLSQVPIININNKVLEEDFGKVNLIEARSPTVSEIILSIIKSLGENLIDQKVAASLYLKENKSLNYLKLLGRALARLKYWEEKQIAWVSFPQEDFRKTEIQTDFIPSILENLKEISGYPLLLTLWEESKSNPSSQKTIKGSILSKEKQLLERLSQDIKGEIKENKLIFDSQYSDLKEALLETLITLGKLI